MGISQKCQYALRALFELSRHDSAKPLKINDIAEAQSIPTRFLEVILNELKHAGFVDSKRGKSGGYFLAKPPSQLTVGEIIRFIQGPLGPVECVNGDPREKCALKGDCALLPLWMRVKEAVSDIYDNTTFRQLVEEDFMRREGYVPNFVI